MTLLAWGLATFVLGAVGVRGFLEISRRRLLAEVGQRSSHARPTPTGGGFPAVLTWLLVTGAAVVAGAIASSTAWWVAAGSAGALAGLGLADDAWDLPRAVRYGVHLLVAIVIVIAIDYAHEPSWLPPVVRAAACVVAITALINLFNFMDGIDGLVGGSGTITLGWLAYWTGEPIWSLLAIAYASFLVFNLPPARIFMGDAGSTTLGGLIGLAFLAGQRHLYAGDLVVLAPLMGDAVYTITRRLLRGENIFRAHHSHLYQRLLRAGHRHGPISAGYAIATIGCGALATWARPWGPAAALGACALAVVLIELHVGRRGVPFTRPA